MVEEKFYGTNLGNKEKIYMYAAVGFHQEFQKHPLILCEELVTAHFLSVYVTPSQDEHLSSLESITFIILFSFLTEHIKSTKSS